MRVMSLRIASVSVSKLMIYPPRVRRRPGAEALLDVNVNVNLGCCQPIPGARP